MRHYLAVYKEFIKTSIAVDLSFRSSFALMALMDVFFYAVTWLSVDFIYLHIDKIGPWDRPEFMFFVSFMLLFNNIHMTFVSESFWMLPRDIKTGQLDYTILRPMAPAFTVFFRYFRPSTFLLLPIVLGVFIYWGQQVELSAVQWFTMTIFGLLGMALNILIEFCFAMSMFWTQEGLGINFLRMQFQSMGRWPEFIFGGAFRHALLIAVPVLMVGSAPAHITYKVGTVSSLYWALALITVFLAYALVFRMLWRMALKRYNSASS